MLRKEIGRERRRSLEGLEGGAIVLRSSERGREKKMEEDSLELLERS